MMICNHRAIKEQEGIYTKKTMSVLLLLAFTRNGTRSRGRCACTCIIHETNEATDVVAMKLIQNVSYLVPPESHNPRRQHHLHTNPPLRPTNKQIHHLSTYSSPLMHQIITVPHTRTCTPTYLHIYASAHSKQLPKNTASSHHTGKPGSEPETSGRNAFIFL